MDPDKLIVTGGSQGGGISIAAAGLAPLAGIELLGCAPDVPFLCHFERAVQITDKDPYHEITRYLKGFRHDVDAALRTLSYFDGVNFAARATAPALFSVGLMDAICPPSTVYAAYNHYAGPKEISVWPYNGHEGGAGFQKAAQIRYLADLFKGESG